MGKLYIELYCYKKGKDNEIMLLAFVKDEQDPKVIDLFHHDTLPQEFCHDVMNEDFNVYMMGSKIKIQILCRLLKKDRIRARCIDMCQRLLWMNIAGKMDGLATLFGEQQMMRQWQIKELNKFTQDNLLGNRRLPDDDEYLWKKVKEHLAWKVRMLRRFECIADEWKLKFPYENISYKKASHRILTWEHGYCMSASTDFDNSSRQKAWYRNTETETPDQVMSYIKEGWRLFYQMQNSSELIDAEIEHRISKYGIIGTYQGLLNLPQYLYKTLTCNGSHIHEKSLALIDYSNITTDFLWWAAGKQWKKVTLDDRMFMFGDGAVGCIKYAALGGLRLSELQMRDRAVWWKSYRPGLISCLEAIVRAVWQVCCTHKEVRAGNIIMMWRHNSLIIKMGDRRALFFSRARLIMENQKWVFIMRIVEGSGKSREVRCNMSELVKIVADAWLEDIVTHKAEILSSLDPEIICTSKNGILFMVDRESSFTDDNVLKGFLHVDGSYVMPDITRRNVG